ncbi:MAG: NDP-sugar synthase [Elusimicrobia bacterium]|nr:NDP-sugar synthase [Elusimicrobiota bacterium]
MRAMILAAGAGTRLRPITLETPKPMVPVVNRPVLHHVLDNLARHDIRDVVMNLHAQPEQIKSYCGDGSRWSLQIRYSYEPKLMGTAGAVKKAEKMLKGGPILIMSGDGLSDVDLTALIKFHREKKSVATMVTKALDVRFEYGVTLSNASGRITGFREKPSWGDVFSNKVNTGIYLIEPEVLHLVPKGRSFDFGHELWPKLLKLKKPIFAWEWKGYWCDVGNLAEYRKAQLDCLNGNVRIHMPGRELRPGVWVEEGSRVHPSTTLTAPCLVGRDVIVDEGCQIGPNTVVGDGAKISPNAVLKNCILFNGVFVSRNVHLSNCIIGAKGSVNENITVYEAAVLNIRQ